MFPTKKKNYATSAQLSKIRWFYEKADMSPSRARRVIRQYEIDGWTQEHADSEILRLKDLEKQGLPTLPEKADLRR